MSDPHQGRAEEEPAVREDENDETLRVIEDVRRRVAEGGMSKDVLEVALISVLDALATCAHGLQQAVRTHLHRRLSR